MISDYLALIKDTVQFAKEQASFPFSECFSIRIPDKKSPSIPSPAVLDLPKEPPTFSEKKEDPKTSIPPRKNEPQKLQLTSYRNAFIQKDVLEDRFEDVKKMIRASQLKIKHVEDIPDDKQGKAIAQNWKYQSRICPILILFHTSSENEKIFLKNLANALSICFFKATTLDALNIEQDDKWDFILDSKIVSFIIAPDDQIWDLPKLMQTYKENPSQSTVTLKEIPLFLIPDLKMYFQNPSLKGSLWKALCQKISRLHQSSSIEN